MDAIFGWFFRATTAQKHTLVAASLGWMLDSMDVMLYALVLGEVQRSMHLSSAMSGAMMSATLVSAAIGGMAFGWFADRFGRARALTWSVLIYSVATGLCGLSQTPLQLLFCRLILGLGMGGEWASGAALVAETWPAQHRAKALAWVQSSWAIGYALGAGVVALVMPRFGWRAVFFAGIFPALIALLVRRGLPEPESWRRERQASVRVGVPIGELFRGRYSCSTLVCATMNAATLFAWWGLFTWAPRFLSMPVAQGGHGLDVLQTSTWTIVMQTGTFLGYVLFGYIAGTFGAKRTYIGYLIIAALLTPAFALVSNPHALLIIGPLVGFFGTGYYSGFSILSSELFPTRLRGTAMGFVYNSGRLVSAAAPYLIGGISERVGLGLALCLTSIAFVVAALIATAIQPPTDLVAQADV
ncbi:MFS transporter [Acidicapsa dinghuensis]|uniref:MFS transporter n=1 Tax=Acidicapsa dinghuensis TaxID=2218256 RepID=A0ABW1EIG0_9BACT|nr:MFS transporter [Acidicapsa dinghuensis]